MCGGEIELFSCSVRQGEARDWLKCVVQGSVIQIRDPDSEVNVTFYKWRIEHRKSCLNKEGVSVNIYIIFMWLN